MTSTKRVFYQIYTEARNVIDFFELDSVLNYTYVPIKTVELYGKLLEAVNTIGNIKSFKDDFRQYVFYVEGDYGELEIKFSSQSSFSRGYPAKFWMQVSAESQEAAEAAYRDILNYIKKWVWKMASSSSSEEGDS